MGIQMEAFIDGDHWDAWSYTCRCCQLTIQTTPLEREQLRVTAFIEELEDGVGDKDRRRLPDGSEWSRETLGRILSAYAAWRSE